MNELPTSAAELNAWLHCNFAIFQGPGRAYFELPFTIRFDQGGESIERVHRVVYMCVGFMGPEAACATRVAEMIKDLHFDTHALEDASIALFVRRPFTYEEGHLRGRLAFWDEETNRKVRGSLMFRPEHGIYNNVTRMS